MVVCNYNINRNKITGFTIAVLYMLIIVDGVNTTTVLLLYCYCTTAVLFIY